MKRRFTSTKNSGTKNTASRVAVRVPPIIPVPIATRLLARAGGDGQRQHPGDKRQRGHDNRAQASLRGADRRPGERIPLIHGGFSELHDRMAFFDDRPMVVSSATWK